MHLKFYQLECVVVQCTDTNAMTAQELILKSHEMEIEVKKHTATATNQKTVLKNLTIYIHSSASTQTLC